MKSLLALTSSLFVCALLTSQSQSPDLGLPELHTIKTTSLSPNYGCRSSQEFSSGYANTALFLSQYSRRGNSPDLLFNGACGAPDEFDVSTAGDDMSLIADLGSVPLEEVTTSKAFNFKRIHSYDLYSRFTQSAKTESGHTYVVVINKSTLRGLFVFSVVNHVPNKQVELRYAVKEYQMMVVREESKGFDWEARNAVLSRQ